MDDQTYGLFQELHKFMFQSVYTNPIAKGEEGKAKSMLVKMYKYFEDNPGQMEKRFNFKPHTSQIDRAICDFISGMSDNYAVKVYTDLFIPKSWQGY